MAKIKDLPEKPNYKEPEHREPKESDREFPPEDPRMTFFHSPKPKNKQDSGSSTKKKR